MGIKALLRLDLGARGCPKQDPEMAAWSELPITTPDWEQLGTEFGLLISEAEFESDFCRIVFAIGTFGLGLPSPSMIFLLEIYSSGTDFSAPSSLLSLPPPKKASLLVFSFFARRFFASNDLCALSFL